MTNLGSNLGFAYLSYTCISFSKGRQPLQYIIDKSLVYILQ